MRYCFDNIFVQGKASLSHYADNCIFWAYYISPRLRKRNFYRCNTAYKYMDCFMFSIRRNTGGNYPFDTKNDICIKIKRLHLGSSLKAVL